MSKTNSSFSPNTNRISIPKVGFHSIRKNETPENDSELTDNSTGSSNQVIAWWVATHRLKMKLQTC